MPDFASAETRALKNAVRAWHKAALPKITTKDFDESWSEFSEAWTRIKSPLGQSTFEKSLERARVAPDPAVALDYDSDDTRLLIRLCRELQQSSGDAPFFLACRTAAVACGLDHMSASRRLSMLVADGVLELVENGTLSKRKAARYRYVGAQREDDDLVY